MPTSFWLLLAVLALGACETRDAVWNPDLGVAVGRGEAVAPWESAQNPSMSAQPDAGDAGGNDGGEKDAAVLSDAGADADGAVDAGEFAGGAVDAGLQAPCVFAVTTLPLGGRYAPKNIGAIWIEDDQGAWVKTLAVWAGVRLRYLAALRAADPTGSRVDAITSGTLRVHERHVLGWDLTNASGAEVADGTYVLQVEVTDRDGTGQTMSAMFIKSADPFVSEPPDSAYFTNVELRCQ